MYPHQVDFITYYKLYIGIREITANSNDIDLFSAKYEEAVVITNPTFLYSRSWHYGFGARVVSPLVVE